MIYRLSFKVIRNKECHEYKCNCTDDGQEYKDDHEDCHKCFHNYGDLAGLQPIFLDP